MNGFTKLNFGSGYNELHKAETIIVDFLLGRTTARNERNSVTDQVEYLEFEMSEKERGNINSTITCNVS